MFILIDNYDSFTYNLVQYFGDSGIEMNVIRNDAVSVQGVIDLKPKAIVISPGPSDPDHAGICLDLTKEAANQNIPLFGVCLGHQTIGQVFGGRVTRHEPMHGKVSNITHKQTDVFAGLPTPFAVTRYHSLIVERDTLPEDLEITAETEDGIIMGLRHKDHPIYGVQFHPESIATENGHSILKNFIHEASHYNKV